MEDCELKLEFDGYKIEKISLEMSNEIVDSKKGIGFLFKMVPDKENEFERVNIIEGVFIEPSEDFGYRLEVIVRGNFRISNCENDKEKYKLLLTNASAILFPYLRAEVSMVSSQIEFENVTLPVMNFYEVFRNQELEDLLLDYKQFKEF
ncbi:MAG: protein-export chaperone SecB [Peptostreptococcaceae bacterium]|nr:protein-export chaperone SecB [Peptostreptococcaceae bacterium]